jgi:hypothetical protein
VTAGPTRIGSAPQSQLPPPTTTIKRSSQNAEQLFAECDGTDPRDEVGQDHQVRAHLVVDEAVLYGRWQPRGLALGRSRQLCLIGAQVGPRDDHGLQCRGRQGLVELLGPDDGSGGPGFCGAGGDPAQEVRQPGCSYTPNSTATCDSTAYAVLSSSVDPLESVLLLEQRLTNALRAVLPVNAPVDVTASHPDAVALHIATTRITAAWLEAGTPKKVTHALASIPGLQLVVAPQFTDAALAALKENGVGWVDELGGAEFAIGSVVVARASRQTPKKRPHGWTRATLGVAEALLLGHKTTVKGLRAVTGASPSTIAIALETLTQAGLLTAGAARGRNSARKIADRNALLDAYAAAAAKINARCVLTVGALWRDPVAGLEALGAQLDAAEVGWAATGALAAAVQAPYQTQVAPWVVYVEAATVADLLNAARAADLQPITGGRLELRSFPTPITERLGQRIGNISVVPWPRAYADLRWSGVRGEGAADHLAEVMTGQETELG